MARDGAPVGTDAGIAPVSGPVTGPAPAVLVARLARSDLPRYDPPRHDPVADPGGVATRPVVLLPSTLTLGPVMIARIVLDGDIPADEALTGLLFIPDDRRLVLHDGTVLAACAGDLVVLPAGGLLRGIGRQPLTCTALLASRRFLGVAMPSRSAVVVMPRSGSTEALRRHVERLRTMGAGVLDAAQAQAAARSIRELLAAAAVPVAAMRHRGAQREEALLDRILDHVDATLGGDVSIPLLCDALACSRSALYRAAAPRGGLVKIVMQQRLLAVHGALQRCDDRRSIAEIARAHGFADASQFSRCFRRAFGISAGRVRRASAHGPADGVLCHPDTTRLFALSGTAIDGGMDGGTGGGH